MNSSINNEIIGALKHVAIENAAFGSCDCDMTVDVMPCTYCVSCVLADLLNGWSPSDEIAFLKFVKSNFSERNLDRRNKHFAVRAARARNECRICHKSSGASAELGHFVLNYGDEFAHQACLEQEAINSPHGGFISPTGNTA